MLTCIETVTQANVRCIEAVQKKATGVYQQGMSNGGHLHLVI